MKSFDAKLNIALNEAFIDDGLDKHTELGVTGRSHSEVFGVLVDQYRDRLHAAINALHDAAQRTANNHSVERFEMLQQLATQLFNSMQRWAAAFGDDDEHQSRDHGRLADAFREHRILAATICRHAARLRVAEPGAAGAINTLDALAREYHEDLTKINRHFHGGAERRSVGPQRSDYELLRTPERMWLLTMAPAEITEFADRHPGHGANEASNKLVKIIEYGPNYNQCDAELAGLLAYWDVSRETLMNDLNDYLAAMGMNTGDGANDPEVDAILTQAGVILDRHGL